MSSALETVLTADSNASHSEAVLERNELADHGNNIFHLEAKRGKESESAEQGIERVIELNTSEEKLEAFTRFIDEGMVMVTLDARPVGVQIPSQFRESHQLNLNFSLKFFLQDFEYDTRGVRGSLSFSGVTSLCDIPWPAVWMMRSHTTGEIALAPKSVPDVLRDEVLREEILHHETSLQEREEAPEGGEHNSVNGLSDVSSDDDTSVTLSTVASNEGPPEDDEATDAPVRPVLRLVKS